MPSLRKAVKRRRIGSIGLKLGLLIVILLAAGFGYFIWQLPSREIALDRNADGIVVLTGGDSRVTDALELLSSGRGKRLLISGVYAGTTTNDIRRQVVDYNRVLSCCVDLDYSAVNTVGNAVQARQWALKNGFLRPVADRAVVVKHRDDQSRVVGILQVSCRQAAHAIRSRSRIELIANA